jgi:hypothetical protein
VRTGNDFGNHMLTLTHYPIILTWHTTGRRSSYRVPPTRGRCRCSRGSRLHRRVRSPQHRAEVPDTDQARGEVQSSLSVLTPPCRPDPARAIFCAPSSQEGTFSLRLRGSPRGRRCVLSGILHRRVMPIKGRERCSLPYTWCSDNSEYTSTGMVARL